MQIGDIFSSPSFMSSSVLGKNDVFASKNVRFILNVKTGKRIDWLSLKPYQREVLILPNTQFKIAHIEQKDNELWLTMTEILTK